MLIFLIAISITILVDISAIFLNGIVAYVLKKQKKTNIVSFWFIYCLSISDVLVGVTALALHIVVILQSLNFSSTLLLLRQIFASGVAFSMSFSGRLILIISIDRCIHMKYLRRYSTIMTKFRARLIMSFNVSLGILFTIIANIAPSKIFHQRFQVGFYAFNMTGVSITYIVYIMTYLLIKRKVGALGSLETSHGVERNAVIKRNPLDCTVSSVRNLNECMKMERPDKIDVTKDSGSAEKIVCIDNCEALQSQGKTFVLPSSKALATKNLGGTLGCNANMEMSGESSNLVNNATSCLANDKGKQSRKPIGSAKVKGKEEAENKSSQMHRKGRAKPEVELQKAVVLILSALFLCYGPMLVYELSASGRENPNDQIINILRTLGLANSSLNAIILVFCNRELKRHIKAMFSSN